MAAKRTITVTFTRDTVAEATIEVPEGFDPTSDTYEEVALSWLDEHQDELVFSHDGIDIQLWNIDADEAAARPAVPGTVTLQRWNAQGYAAEVDEARFDAAPALDSVPLSELPEFADGFHDDGFCNYGDDIFHAAVRLGALGDWDGPFECYVDEDAYAAYYDARASEAGLSPVER